MKQSNRAIAGGRHRSRSHRAFVRLELRAWTRCCCSVRENLRSWLRNTFAPKVSETCASWEAQAIEVLIYAVPTNTGGGSLPNASVTSQRQESALRRSKRSLAMWRVKEPHEASSLPLARELVRDSASFRMGDTTAANFNYIIKPIQDAYDTARQTLRNGSAEGRPGLRACGSARCSEESAGRRKFVWLPMDCPYRVQF